MYRLNTWLYISCFVALLVCTDLTAKQVSFSKKQQQDGYTFNYQWLDSTKTLQHFNFTLTNNGLFKRFRDFKTYQPTFAQKSILRTMKKHLQKNPIAGVHIFYRQINDEISIEVKGRDDSKVAKAYQDILKLEQKVTNDYFKSNYYHTFINFDQEKAIKVNHASIADDSVQDLKPLKPLILAKVSIQNIREVTNYVLNFIQSIPYATLENRMTSSGAGFNTPLKLLWENQGDCDSKMTLTAALLRALMPRIEMAMIYIEQHAFIGIAIPAETGEMNIKHQGIHYVLADPTGPSLLPLGQLSPESKLAINQGRYVVENYHAPIVQAPQTQQ